MIAKVVFFIGLSLVSFGVFSQENNIAIGAWRVHLPYQNMNTVAVSGKRAYAALGSGIFYYDKEEKSITALSKYSGLNDVIISKVGYNETQDVFLLGYQTGNIDLIQGNTITNANEIARKNFTGSKKINHFHSNGNDIYIAGDFGVVLYDLKKKEVRESYITLTSDGTSNNVYASTLTSDKDSIFIATAKGVMTAKVNSSINLMDYNNWYTFQTTDSIDTLNVVSVSANAGVVYAAVNNKGIYYYNGSKWRKLNIPITGGGKIRSLAASGNAVLACVDSAVFKITSPSAWEVVFNEVNVTPTEAYYDAENTLWLSTLNAGLMQVKDNVSSYFFPNGPLTNGVFRFSYYNNNLIELAGGYNSIGQKSYFPDWFNIFEDNTSWVSGRYKYINSIPSTFGDFISATYNTTNSTLYFSCYGDGLVAIKPDDGSVQIYNASNSPLQKEGLTNTQLFVGETAVDTDGNLWVPMHGISAGLPNLHSLSKDGVWSNYIVSSAINKSIIGVTLDDNKNKWLTTAAPSGQTGVIIYNEETAKTRTLNTNVGEGLLPDIKINCITKDKKGAILVGTNKGLAICYDASVILNAGVDLTTPIFEGFPILFDRNVLSIEIDGGNRKWIGTNDGLWLFDEDLTKVLLYFDEENSPLLSDNIMAIKVHPKSGEVFFATPLGLCSYRGSSTEGDENFTDVKVFPNPVKPGFDGLVGISGLAPNVSVKITDVSGNLVYETKAQGGTATWNVKDYNGRRAATGVYLIFTSNADGTSKFVSKMAVIE